MMNHMNSLVDEVRQIESKVIAISKLQETFTEKVLQQVSLTLYTLVHSCILLGGRYHCYTSVNSDINGECGGRK